MSRRILALVHDVHQPLPVAQLEEVITEHFSVRSFTQANVRPRSMTVAEVEPRTLLEAQSEQRKLLPEVRRHLLESAELEVAYFGFAHQNLAFDLGAALCDHGRIHAFQHGKASKSYHWSSPRDLAAEFVSVEGLPADTTPDPREIIVRVSCTNTVGDEAVDEVERGQLRKRSQLDIHVRVAATGSDALLTMEELDVVASAFEQVLRTIEERRPNARAIHLFDAVPTGLAFKLGTKIRPNVTPEVVCYHFRTTSMPRYRRSISVHGRAAAVLGDIASELRQLVYERQVVFVAGAGLSMAVSDGAPTASWSGLLAHGIEECSVQNLISADQEREWQRALENYQFTDLGDEITKALGGEGGGDFKAWLAKALGRLEVIRPELVQELGRLNCPIITTNYDDLIAQPLGHGRAVWTEAAEVERTLRHGESNVIHLHGHYREPTSIVLGRASYDRWAEDAFIDRMLEAMFTVKTFIFIGVGDGMGDPHFTKLLTRAAEAFGSSMFDHYWLVKEPDVKKRAASLPTNSRMKVRSLGPTDADLPRFLHALT